MKKNFLLISIFILNLIFSFVKAEPLSAITDDAEVVIKKTMTTFMRKNNIPGIAIQAIIKGKMYTFYSGFADNQKQLPITSKTIFEVGSISKIMTSILFTQEIDFAKMSLTDSVRKYLPELPSTFDQITLQELATHTAGLPGFLPKTIKEQDELQHFLLQWKPKYTPGKSWIYSNIGIGLLGYALEGSTLRNFDDLYWRHITSPLKMQRIGTVLSETQKDDYAQGYDSNNQPVQHEEEGLFPAAYGIKMSADDMQLFLSAAIGLPGTPERIFYPLRMTQASYLKLADREQGLGWQIHDLKKNDIHRLLQEPVTPMLGPTKVIEVYDRAYFKGNALIDKSGTTKGFQAYIAVIPNLKSGVAILANKSLPNGMLVNKGREILFKLTHLLT